MTKTKTFHLKGEKPFFDFRITFEENISNITLNLREGFWQRVFAIFRSGTLCSFNLSEEETLELQQIILESLDVKEQNDSESNP